LDSQHGFYDASLNIVKGLVRLLNSKSILRKTYFESINFFNYYKNHFPPILFTYVGAFMLIATFVRCLSELNMCYINFICRNCHTDHGQNEQIQLCRDRWLMVDKRCKVHIFSYQIFYHQIKVDLLDIFGRHNFKEHYP
jgi:hypothetical protein